MSDKEWSKTLIYLTMGFMVLTGAANTILMKLQSAQDAYNYPYKHFFFQTMCMFLGESLTIFVYIYYSFRNGSNAESHPEEAAKKECPPYVILIPAMCDLFGSTLTFFALSFMAGSVYQMIRGAIVFITALFSLLFLKSKLYRHHLASLCIVFIGIFLVGLSSQLHQDDGDKQQKTEIIGIVMLLISLLFNGFQFISEEMIMNKYKAHPLKLVGWEGIWGLIVYLVLVIVFQFIKCEPTELLLKICTPDQDGTLYLETVLFALKQIGANLGLLFLIIGGIFSIAFFNFFGISLTKYVSASSRAVVDNSRTILIWMFFLAIGFEKWTVFSFLQLSGFVLTVFGALMYNEIVVLPFLGFNLYTRDAIKERKLREQMIIENDDYSLGIGLGKDKKGGDNFNAQ
jgi:drug/metabolite transporter (DMT)-like permease